MLRCYRSYTVAGGTPVGIWSEEAMEGEEGGGLCGGRRGGWRRWIDGVGRGGGFGGSLGGVMEGGHLEGRTRGAWWTEK